jgi:GT2 family glycosyltransferase
VTDASSVWVGTIDLDLDCEVTSVTGPITADHIQARVLVRLHGAPLGYVGAAVHPESTLPGRVAAAADAILAEPLRQHRSVHEATAQGMHTAKSATEPGWEADVTCPLHFPAPTGAGISVVVCTRNRPEVLRECLQVLQGTSYEPAEFLVVDNAPSGDATRQVVADLARADPRIRYTCERRPGLSRARNRGLAEAQYELIAFTDDDILVEPTWLSAMAAGFASDPSAACVTGPVAARSLDTPSERYFDSRYPWGDALQPRRFDLKLHRVESPLYPFNAGIFGTGANFGIRRTVASELGGFDPLLGAGGPGKGGEDLDMFLRLVRAGYRICYLPTALVWHRHRSNDKALAEQVYGYGHGLGAYVAKRLITREMSARMLARSLAHSLVLADRVREAAQASQFKTRKWHLAALEASGTLAGAARFFLAWCAARRA